MKTKKLIILLVTLLSTNFAYCQISGNYTIENDSLKAIISLPSMTISATYKVNNKTYTTQSLSGYTVKSASNSSASKLVVVATNPTGNFSMTVTYALTGNSISMTLAADANANVTDQFQFPSHIENQSTDYVIVPRASGVMFPASDYYPFYNLILGETKATMSFAGTVDKGLKAGYMIVTEDPWEDVIHLMQYDIPVTCPRLTHQPVKGKFGYTRTCHLVFVNNGYVEMAQWYRKLAIKKGWLKTFKEKAVANPNVNNMKGAINFWIPMSVDIPFFDKLVGLGFDKGLLTPYYPNKTLINNLNQRGFLTSTYDNYFDVWPTNVFPEATDFKRAGYPNNVMIDTDGSMVQGWLSYYNGQPFQGYELCPTSHAAYARQTLPALLKDMPLNARFVDVEFSFGLSECYSSTHPMTRKEDAAARINLMNVLKNENSLITGAEESHDWAYPVLDYSEGSMTIAPPANANYDWWTPLTDPGQEYIDYSMNPQIRIPLLALVYHDSHMPTTFVGDGVSKVPSYWSDKDLFNILYATMPTFTPAGEDYWNTNFDRFMESYHLTSSLTRNVAFEQMTNHTYVTSDRKVQQSEFSNGWKVTVNFNTSSYQFGNKLLSAKGLYATDGTQNEIFKIVDSNSNLAVAFTGDRLYINPFGTEKTYKGVKTTGSVFFRKDASSLHLGFIGNQTTIKINPSLMPWLVKKAYSETTGKEITMTSLGSGWYQINRPTGENFIRFDYDQTMGTEDELLNEEIKYYPNPVVSELHIDLELSESQDVNIRILDLAGKTIKEFNKNAMIGTNNLVVNVEGTPSGSYILAIKTKGKSFTKKIIVL